MVALNAAFPRITRGFGVPTNVSVRDDPVVLLFRGATWSTHTWVRIVLKMSSM